jgi:hypothetical protein
MADKNRKKNDLNETAEMPSPGRVRNPGEQASDARAEALRGSSSQAAWQLGYDAARNPAFAGKRFDEIEDQLLKTWSNDLRDSHGEWASVRGFAQEAYGQRPRP